MMISEEAVNHVCRVVRHNQRFDRKEHVQELALKQFCENMYKTYESFHKKSVVFFYKEAIKYQLTLIAGSSRLQDLLAKAMSYRLTHDNLRTRFFLKKMLAKFKKGGYVTLPVDIDYLRLYNWFHYLFKILRHNITLDSGSSLAEHVKSRYSRTYAGYSYMKQNPVSKHEFDKNFDEDMVQCILDAIERKNSTIGHDLGSYHEHLKGFDILSKSEEYQQQAKEKSSNIESEYQIKISDLTSYIPKILSDDPFYNKQPSIIQDLEKKEQELNKQLVSLDGVIYTKKSELRELQSKRDVIQKELNAFHLKLSSVASELIK